jgi:hypothetical protein
MSRAWQAERAAEREMEQIDRDFENGLLTADEHRKAVREVEYEIRCAHEADLEDAAERVRDEWGW